ncbi:ABC transporter ATP-binding protein [Pseudonocardia humida]|uniref:ABC transporter ATP-binding protein n=1 Tax=Pseudonocardia humida TaxID=2800819 RepID=A0ABT1A7J5_9PSEU|nr:ABC transporter ATP-binding protein [Pseudonocardia humida]MCO1658997.1 ABC transporter ATP-binding protein [Pseudonocardia humida]
MAAELAMQGVSLRFGGIEVLQEVSFTVEPGQIFGLVGPNGAGKTSLFNCISGHYKPTAGTVSIDGTPVQGARPATLARHGLARTFQQPALQLQETVLENVLLGAHTQLPGGPLEWAVRTRRTKRAEERFRVEALDLLERNGLAWAAHLPADELSHGLHKGVELCRALLMKPRLLLLDEPAAGLPHAEVEHLIAAVRRLRAEDDITVVIVEHNMGLIAALTDRVVVLDHGRKLMEGTAAEAQSDPRVIEAYIGKDAADDVA